MRKYTILAALFALASAATAQVRDTRQAVLSDAAPAVDRTVLRPADLTMPAGYVPQNQRHLGASTVAPDANLKATNWSILNHENGSNWFYSQDFTQNADNAWYYASTDVTIYNDRLKQQAKVHIDAPEGELCNSIQPFGLVTSKFFDINDQTWEFLVYVHCVTADYLGHNYIYVVNNLGEVLYRYDGYAAQFVESGSGFNASRHFLVGRDDYSTGDYTVDVYKKAGWYDGPTVEHTFSVPMNLITYSSGAAVNAFSIDNQAYYTVSYYEQPYESGLDDNYQVITTPDNNFVVDVYDASYNLVTTVKEPIPVLTNGYSMRTFGYFSYEDLSRSYNQDGSDKLNIVITHEDYLTSTGSDSYLYSWTVYNEDGELINTLGANVIDWWPLSTVRGQSEQVAFYTIDGDGNGHIECWDIPSCTFAAGFDSYVEGLPISTSFDRAPAPNGVSGYDYVVGINQGYSDSEGNVLGVIAWFTPEGVLDRRVNFNLGPNAQYFTAAISQLTLNPYTFNTDDGVEYLYRVKAGRGDGSNVIDDLIVVADSAGNPIRSFSSTTDYDALASCDILYDSTGNPVFLISYYSSDTYESDINLYDLPFTTWPGGGSGTAADPYVITSVGDLMRVSDNLTAHYVVDRDLDFISLPDGWTPLGQFSGTLDGQGHTFRNFYLNTEDYYVGLFGIANGATISNITFDAPEVEPMSTNNYVGLVVGYSLSANRMSNIEVLNPRVVSDVNVGCYGNIAGIAAGQSSVSNCAVTNACIQLPNTSNVGGLVGDSRTSTTVSACYVDGLFEGRSDVGGVVGSSSTGCAVENCHVKVDVTADNSVGAVVGGSKKRGLVSHCIAEGNVKATGATVSGFAAAGALIGYLEPDWNHDTNNACMDNVSHALVEGAGTTSSVHRIVGYCVNDVQWSPEDIANGKAFNETGVLFNYSTAPEVEGMDLGYTGVDGQTIDDASLTETFLTDQLGFVFGSSATAPWVHTDGVNQLYYESEITGIGSVIADEPAAADQLGDVQRGTFDLQGRRVDSAARPGFYIVDGRKTIIR